MLTSELYRKSLSASRRKLELISRILFQVIPLYLIQLSRKAHEDSDHMVAEYV